MGLEERSGKSGRLVSSKSINVEEGEIGLQV